MNRTAYIVSVKYAAGSNKEFVMFGDNLWQRGFNVRYILSELYKNLGWHRDDSDYITTSDGIKSVILDTIKYFDGKSFLNIFSSYAPKFLLFYNAHPLNIFIARLVKKKFPDAVIALYLHEPYKPDKAPYGVLKGIYIYLVEFIQGLTLRYMDYVISPSEYSSLLFKRKYPNYKRQNFITPLLIPDQKKSSPDARRFFSMVGTANKATGHDTFIELVNYVGEKGLDFEFALISSSNVSGFTRNLTEEGKKRLKVINKNSITDTEINEIIRQSWAVFRLDKEVTQSGVLPVAYMNETPVIARDIQGLTQHVRHGENGYIVPFDCKPESLVEAMSHVMKNFFYLSKNARRSYEETWAEKNFDKYYSTLIGELLVPEKRRLQLLSGSWKYHHKINKKHDS